MVKRRARQDNSVGQALEGIARSHEPDGERRRSRAAHACNPRLHGWDRANDDAPGFSERALEHIRQTMLAAPAHARLRGEDIVNSAKISGIRPPDDRAFGAIFAKAIRDGLIEPVGYAPRTKGHGTAGGRVYSLGEGLA